MLDDSVGEGIYIYGMNGGKRRYTKDLQSFATTVIANGRAKGSLYRFGKVSKTILSELARQGIRSKTETAAILDKTILKYKNHPKRSKGAVVSFRRFKMVEAAVKKPKHVYIDTHRNRLVFVSSVKYAKGKVLKVVIEPNQKFKTKFYHTVTSIGVVNAYNMAEGSYKKIK
ncbi:MAG: hypothetical protein MJZ41_07620 [Bacteroidaceae bacterium]|nr:hypothetical protein [Bacteroidaceae bacterium]